MKSESLPLGWEKLKILSMLAATILVPVVIAIAGQTITQSLKEREISVKYVELAINILSNKATLESIGLRDWAIEIIVHHSEVKPPDSMINDLQDGKLLEFQQIQQIIQKHNETAEKIMEEIGR